MRAPVGDSLSENSVLRNRTLTAHHRALILCPCLGSYSSFLPLKTPFAYFPFSSCEAHMSHFEETSPHPKSQPLSQWTVSLCLCAFILYSVNTHRIPNKFSGIENERGRPTLKGFIYSLCRAPSNTVSMFGYLNLYINQVKWKKNNSLIVMAHYKCLHNTHRAPASQKVLLDITVKEGGEVDFSFSLSLTHTNT